ncbi:unnamed protein product [Brassica rapa subsp. narinosa]
MVTGANLERVLSSERRILSTREGETGGMLGWNAVAGGTFSGSVVTGGVTGGVDGGSLGLTEGGSSTLVEGGGC